MMTHIEVGVAPFSAHIVIILNAAGALSGAVVDGVSPCIG